jgi:2-polyprenyl-3-methyl-5-hydroxy-6-metoxy-1,4-benzoquinol methylase
MAVIEQDAQGNRFELRPISCPVCERDNARILGVRGGRHHRYGLGIATPIAQCRSCGLLYPNPFPFPLDHERLYGDPSKYFARHDPRAKVEASTAFVRELQRRSGRREISLLDVGSGRGELLYAARNERVDRAVGLEFSSAMVEFAKSEYGVTVIPSTIEAYAAESPQHFDAVVLKAVLEHVHDPDSMIRAAACLTRRGAILYVDIPNEPNLLSWVARMGYRALGRNTLLDLSPTFEPFHVFGFNPRALRCLLSKHGFLIDSIEVRANPSIPATRDWKDKLQAVVGEQINRIANMTGTAANMFVWARRT